jgi:hypothetical protein
MRSPVTDSLTEPIPKRVSNRITELVTVAERITVAEPIAVSRTFTAA